MRVEEPRNIHARKKYRVMHKRDAVLITTTPKTQKVVAGNAATNLVVVPTDASPEQHL
ncbi:hypothetical protein FNO01nite_33640 [Flavobacterium noncentrifugens]|nr:hypothetical protein FNO01nite_33640 [Flavobacterium noncentrifugens]